MTQIHQNWSYYLGASAYKLVKTKQITGAPENLLETYTKANGKQKISLLNKVYMYHITKKTSCIQTAHI